MASLQGMEKEMTKNIRDFESAREFARSLKLRGSIEWWIYCKSGNKPLDIPTNPNRTYKNKGWKGFRDFLGNEIKRKDFSEAREFTHKLKLTSVRGWEKYCKSGDKPDDMPSNPNDFYEHEWMGWSDFLNTNATRNYKNFNDAREFARKLGLKGITEWQEYCVSGNKPLNVSSRPDTVYKKEWVDWRDWLGLRSIGKWRNFKEAREFVRSLGLKNRKEWTEYCKSGNKPDDIPSSPWDVYKEWKKK